MMDKNEDKQIEKLISEAMKMQDTASAELNNQIKAELYAQEAAMRKSTPKLVLSLWYIPMLLNTALFSLLIVTIFLIVDNPYIARSLASACGYMIVSGIVITLVGIKRFSLKERFSIRLQKGGEAL